MFKFLILCALITIVYGRSVNVGQTYESNGIRKVYEENLDANAFPLFKREKFLNIKLNDIIKGIAITDLDNALAEASIRMGGLGFNYADIKLKSQRGSGFNYHIAVYA